jgi:hypothetical protein
MRVFILVTLLASAADAGRRPWLFAEDTTMVPDGDVEIESWVDFIDRKQDPGAWRWWIGAYWSPIESLEVAALTAIQQPYEPLPPEQVVASLWIEHLSLRWRVIERRFGSLFLKLEGRIAFNEATPFQVQPSIAWAKHVGRFGFAASFGYAAGFEGPDTDPTYHWLTYRAAASVDVVRGEMVAPFQLGVEMYAQQTLAGPNDLSGNRGSTVSLGPTLAVARGRLWLTLGTLAGLTPSGPTIIVRGLIGLAL